MPDKQEIIDKLKPVTYSELLEARDYHEANPSSSARGWEIWIDGKPYPGKGIIPAIYKTKFKEDLSNYDFYSSEDLYREVFGKQEFKKNDVKVFKKGSKSQPQFLAKPPSNPIKSFASPQVIRVPENPLNQILYGPPGTGKTYATRSLAVAIAEGLILNSNLEIIETVVDEIFEKYNLTFNAILNQKPIRTKINAIYNHLVEKNRILFTTFHQSLGYEDFIEGIKPVADGGIIYEVTNGLLKHFVQGESFDQLWREYTTLIAENENYTALSPDGTVNYNISINPDGTINLGGGQPFVVSRHTIKGLYEKYLVDNLRLSRLEIERVASTSTISTTYVTTIYNDFIQFYEENHNESLTKVIIIDEINRGNVSAIFGELITLIEDGKRAGQPEELSVVLPYSREPFTLPANLYIIGTMNTADRSVEALDTALRRRFDFVEMMPRPDLLEDVCEEFDLEEVLTVINQRLTWLKDKNHTIGHAFFMGCDSPLDVIRVIAHKVLPLLEEFFYGDTSKIGLVLSPEFLDDEVHNGEDIFTNSRAEHAGILLVDLSDNKPRRSLSGPELLDYVEDDENTALYMLNSIL